MVDSTFHNYLSLKRHEWFGSSNKQLDFKPRNKQRWWSLLEFRPPQLESNIIDEKLDLHLRTSIKNKNNNNGRFPLNFDISSFNHT